MKRKIYLIGLIACFLATYAGSQTGKTTAVTLDSFTTGQVSPYLEARQRYPKYNSSLRTLENFLISPLGPVQRRPGTRYVATAKTGTPRLLKFEYSTDDVYAIEAGDEYFRFYRDGAQIQNGGSAYEIATPFEDTELWDIRYAQSDNWMYAVDGNDPPQIITRTAHNAWTCADIAFVDGPFSDENEDESFTITPSATTGTINLVASSALFDDDHVGALWEISHIVDSNKISGQFWTNGDSNSVENLDIYVGQEYTLTTSGYWQGTCLLQRSIDDGTTWDTVKPFSYSFNGNVLYTDRAGHEAGIEDEQDAIYRVRLEDQLVTSHMSRHGEGKFNYILATDMFTRRGIVEIATVTDSTHATATVITSLDSTDATWRWAEGAWSDYRGWPKTVTFHQQRAIYGGSESYPTTLWFSETGADNYNEFKAGTLDTDAFTRPMQGQNPIRWLLSGDYLLVGTSTSVGKYGKQGLPLTPTMPGYQEQSTHGSAAIQAVTTADTVLYVERGMRKLREFGYAFQYDRYTTPELTLLSQEITDPCVVEIAFQKRPQPILWCILGDGNIATLTYYRDQAVAGWSKQTTTGEFKSLMATPGSGTTPSGDTWTEDVLWTIAERNVNGTDYSMVEQFTPLDWGDDVNDCWFVDSGLSTGDDLVVAASTFTGMDHLATEEVCLYGDANNIGSVTVSAGGVITPGGSYTNMTAGLNYTSKLETLPLVLLANSPLARISDMKLTALNFSFMDTNYLKYSKGSTGTMVVADFEDDFVTSEIAFKRLLFSFGSLGKPTIYVETDEPVPLGIRAIIPEVTYYLPR